MSATPTLNVSTGTDRTRADTHAYITGFGLSYAITSVLSALLVLLKETVPAVHDALTALTGHHWVSHGLLDVVLFVGLGFVLARMSDGWRMTDERLSVIIVSATIASGLIIAGFFI